jgi:hypothetical protein
LAKKDLGQRVTDVVGMDRLKVVGCVGIPLELYPYELTIFSGQTAVCLPANLPMRGSAIKSRTQIFSSLPFGACTFGFDADPSFIANCHCLDCKKASGGEMATFMGAPESDFTLNCGTPKSFPYVADSGKRLRRNFCPDCGARLFTSHLEGFPGPDLLRDRQPGSARSDHARNGNLH